MNVMPGVRVSVTATVHKYSANHNRIGLCSNQVCTNFSSVCGAATLYQQTQQPAARLINTPCHSVIMVHNKIGHRRPSSTLACTAGIHPRRAQKQHEYK